MHRDSFRIITHVFLCAAGFAIVGSSAGGCEFIAKVDRDKILQVGGAGGAEATGGATPTGGQDAAGGSESVGGAGGAGGAGGTGGAGAIGGAGGMGATLGTMCVLGSECASGICADGVCCDKACAGSCESCLKANTDGTNGSCSATQAATECRAAAGDCDIAESCDGMNTDCPTDAFLPDGDAGNGPACTAYLCDGMGPACASTCTTKADCVGDLICGAGQCIFGHTIAIDGTNDFTNDEKFPTTTGAFDAWLTWDATFLYLAMKGPDVAADDANKHLVAYFEGGSTTKLSNGLTFNTQTPTLKIDMGYAVSWSTNNSSTKAWGASMTWTDLAWNFTGDVYQQGDFVELRVPLADIEVPVLPTNVAVHISMINATPNFEFTFAGVPSTSFTDAYGANYDKYLQFEIGGLANPSTFTPKP